MFSLRLLQCVHDTSRHPGRDGIKGGFIDSMRHPACGEYRANGPPTLAPMSDERPPRDTATNIIGAAIAIGAGIGAAMFAAADNPVWIGVGAGLGAAIGTAIQRRRGE